MILTLVVLHPIRSLALIPKTHVVKRFYATLPVALENILCRGMYVILPSYEIPHEISPVHPAKLEIEEEFHVLGKSRFLVIASRHRLALAIHVALIELNVIVIIAPHPRKEHLARGLVNSVDRTLNLLVFAIQRRPVSL